jgi:hypothetical protein
MEEIYSDIDWAAIIDILAREYGWTIEYIKSLDLGQITTLLQAIKARYDKQNNNEENPDDISDLKALGGKERTREDGRKEIVI